jgi:hypothetical protein
VLLKHFLIINQWTAVQKTGTAKSRTKGATKNDNFGKIEKEKIDGSSNPPPHAEPQTEKVINDTEEPEIMDSRIQSSPPPNGKDTGAPGQAEGTLEIAPSPSYADIAKKKAIDPSSSSEDEILERPAKRAGRKSHKEAREEEAERQKTQGSQPTIEMSINRNTRIRSLKGGGPTTPNSK